MQPSIWTPDTDPTQPGLYVGVPMREYLLLDAVSASELHTLSTSSAAHVQAARDRIRDDNQGRKSAFDVGSGVHAALLEPEVWEREFVAGGRCEGVKRDGERCTKTASYVRGATLYCGTHDPDRGEPSDRTILTPGDAEKVAGTVVALKAHPRASMLLTTEGPVEMVMVWEDPTTGLLCKARPDKWVPHLEALVDLKTEGRGAHPSRLGRSCWDYGYHLKAAHYMKGASVLQMNVADFLFVFAETSKPHGVVLATLHPEDQDRAWVQHTDLIEQIQPCVERDEWHGYPPTIHQVELPGYARHELDEAQDEDVGVAA